MPVLPHWHETYTLPGKISNMRLTPVIISIVAGAILLAQCDMPRKKKEEPTHPQKPAPPEWKKPAQKISYHAERAKEWSRKKKDSLNSAQQKVIMVVNRVDMANLPSLDSIIIPNDLSGDIVYYLPSLCSCLSWMMSARSFFSLTLRRLLLFMNMVILYMPVQAIWDGKKIRHQPDFILPTGKLKRPPAHLMMSGY